MFGSVRGYWDECSLAGTVPPALSRQNELSRQSGTYVGPDARKRASRPLIIEPRSLIMGHTPTAAAGGGKKTTANRISNGGKRPLISTSDRHVHGGLMATTRDLTVRK